MLTFLRNFSLGATPRRVEVQADGKLKVESAIPSLFRMEPSEIVNRQHGAIPLLTKPNNRFRRSTARMDAPTRAKYPWKATSTRW